MTDDLADFAKRLPKAELHLHIEGTLEPEMMFELARRNGIKLPYESVGAVRAAYDFSNLQDFPDLYYAGASVLRTEEDFRDLTLAYVRRLHADGGVHAEIFFDPQTHTMRGIPFGAVVNGIDAGLTEAEQTFGVTSRLIPNFLRHLTEEQAFDTLRQAEPYLERFTGFGLDSSELGRPPSKFARVFEAVRQRGLKVLAHAGEEGPADYVWEAVDILHVDRIDHGNHALDDAELVQRLVRDGVTLTVCPLSNLKLCVVRDLTRHPIKRMLELGLRATINSDDPAYFGGYLLANYIETSRATGLTKGDLAQLARNSFTGSFLPTDAINTHLAKIDSLRAN